MIGFSVDYVVHLANAYLEAPYPQRRYRVVFTITTMGTSVVNISFISRMLCFYWLGSGRNIIIVFFHFPPIWCVFCVPKNGHTHHG